MIKMENTLGMISITDEVFTNLAGEAATGCFGVKGMVACPKEGGPWQLLRRESMSKGVRVKHEADGSVSLELHIGVDTGVPIRFCLVNQKEDHFFCNPLPSVVGPCVYVH